MIQTTTPSVEGHRITNYLGIVTGEAIMGANLFKDLFASIRDVVGGRSAAYEEELRKARTLALDELSDEASRLGGQRHRRRGPRLRGNRTKRQHADGERLGHGGRDRLKIESQGRPEARILQVTPPTSLGSRFPPGQPEEVPVCQIKPASSSRKPIACSLRS